MYLGEIVRRVLLRIAEEDALFRDTIPPNMALPFKLRNPDIYAIHSDTSADFKVTGRIFGDSILIECSKKNCC